MKTKVKEKTPVKVNKVNKVNNVNKVKKQVKEPIK